MYWYILFVRTGQEEKIEYLLKRLFEADVFVPFVPMIETLFKFSGQVIRERKPLFPGYVFIESELPGLDFVKKIRRIMNTSQDVLCLLRYGNSEEIAIREYEKNMLMRLCNEDYCIEPSVGIIEGNKICISEGPLKGLENIIRKIDRHKRKAMICLDFMGEARPVNVALDIVQKS